MKKIIKTLAIHASNGTWSLADTAVTTAILSPAIIVGFLAIRFINS